VLKIFNNEKCNSVPVVDNAGKMIGVVSKSDIRGLVKSGIWKSLNQPVGDLLTSRDHGNLGPSLDNRVITPDDALETALAKLVQKDIYELFVLDQSEMVVGKITLARMMKHVLSVR
jgi:CBS-domain-containing membrane protein